MIEKKKKGFTIVELTIVIAVIAILAAVLIPTFSSIVAKANLSADKQLVAQMNTVLKSEKVLTDKEITEDVAKELLAENGITVGELKSKGYELKFVEGLYYIYKDGACIYPENTTNGDVETQQYTYTVHYYQQNVEDDKYTEVQADQFTGTEKLGTTVQGEIKTYTGFKLSDQNKNDLTIGADVSKNVIELFYDRIEYTVILEKDNNIESVTGAGKYRYGASVTISATPENHYEFAGWSGDTVKNDGTIVVNGNMTLKATAKEKEYSIEYKLNNGTNAANAPTTYTVTNKTITLPTPTRDNINDIKITRKDDASTEISTEISWQFVGWKIGDSIYKAGKGYTVSNVGERISAEAIWVRKVVYTYNQSTYYKPLTAYFTDDAAEVYVYGALNNNKPQAMYNLGSEKNYYYEKGKYENLPEDTAEYSSWDVENNERVVGVGGSQDSLRTLVTYMDMISS